MQIKIANLSDFGGLVSGFAISNSLQEIMVCVDQMESYGKGVEVLEKLARVKVCEAQPCRLPDMYSTFNAADIPNV